MRRAIRFTVDVSACAAIAFVGVGCGAAHDPRSIASKTAPATAAQTPSSAPRLSAGIVRLPRQAVAKVGSRLITRSAFEHWMRVTAVTDFEPSATRPVPQGLVNAGPGYRLCIARLAAEAEAAKRPRATKVALRRECEQDARALRQQTLERLIIADWVAEEARQAHVRLTAGDLRRGLQRRFGSSAGFERYLRVSGLDAADVRLTIAEQILSGKWHETVLPVYERLRHSKSPETLQMAAEVDTEVADLTKRMTAKWTPRTACRRSYENPLCGIHAR